MIKEKEDYKIEKMKPKFFHEHAYTNPLYHDAVFLESA